MLLNWANINKSAERVYRLNQTRLASWLNRAGRIHELNKTRLKQVGQIHGLSETRLAYWFTKPKKYTNGGQILFEFFFKSTKFWSNFLKSLYFASEK